MRRIATVIAGPWESLVWFEFMASIRLVFCAECCHDTPCLVALAHDCLESLGDPSEFTVCESDVVAVGGALQALVYVLNYHFVWFQVSVG